MYILWGLGGLYHIVYMPAAGAYTLIVQIIVTLNNCDGFILLAFLVGGGGQNQKIYTTNNVDGFKTFTWGHETNNHDGFHRYNDNSIFLHTL